MDILRIFFSRIYLIAIFILPISCSQVRDPLKRNEVENKVFEAVSLGAVRTLEDKEFDLDKVNADAIVLVFASDTCSTCIEEAKYWKIEFENGKPKNIFFAHYLLGGYIEDAIFWRDENKITWDIFYNVSDSLYQRYCSAIITPCFVIKNNKTQEISQSYKVLKKEDIERITGLWTY